MEEQEKRLQELCFLEGEWAQEGTEAVQSLKRKPKQGYTRGNVRDIRPGAEEVGPGSQTEP